MCMVGQACVWWVRYVYAGSKNWLWFTAPTYGSLPSSIVMCLCLFEFICVYDCPCLFGLPLCVSLCVCVYVSAFVCVYSCLCLLVCVCVCLPVSSLSLSIFVYSASYLCLCVRVCVHMPYQPEVFVVPETERGGYEKAAAAKEAKQGSTALKPVSPSPHFVNHGYSGLLENTHTVSQPNQGTFHPPLPQPLTGHQLHGGRVTQDPSVFRLGFSHIHQPHVPLPVDLTMHHRYCS